MGLLFIYFFILRLYLNLINFGYIIEWLFLNFNSINVEFFMLIDWISCLFIRIVILISSIIILYRIVYMRGEVWIDRFVKLVNLFILSIIFIIISPNLIRILFGWDGLGLSSYCLVIYYQNYLSYNSGIVTVLCNRIGDIGLLIAIRLIFIFGRWNLYFLGNFKLILIIIFLAAITKRAQIPFSVWLPIAIAAPTPVSALVHSSTLVTAGVYLLIRFNKFLVNRIVDKILFYLSIFTIFISGLMANFENDLKKIIALSTLRQLGLIIIILSLGFDLLAFFHLLTHAIFKSLLFICAGIIIHLINNNQDIRFCGKLNEFIPFTMLRFYISRIALIGFPFLAGFYSKDLIIEIIYINNINIFFFFIIILSLSFTVSYTFRLFYYIYYGEIKSKRFYYYNENILINLSILILLIIRLIRGSILSWLFFFDNFFLFIRIDIKIVTILILIIGLFLGKFIYLKNLINLYFYRYFFSSMWFMNYMYIWIYKPFLILGRKCYELDKGWIEYTRKNLFLRVIKEIKIIKNLYKIYIFIFMVFFLLVLNYVFL